MGANRLEKFTTQIINRQTINEADYNPRRISDASAKKLRKFLRDHGLWQPLIVNKQTMTLVSGHQRLAAMDTLLRKPDYDLTVALVDVDEETEIKGNVFMNNPSAQGEWDIAKLESLADIIPDLSFENDFGFDASEVTIMFGEDRTEAAKKAEEKTETQEEVQEMGEVSDYRDIKKKTRDEHKEAKSAGVGVGAHVEDIDYSVTVVFPNNHEKHRFMRAIRKPERETHIKHTILHDIENHIYKISEVSE